MNKFRKRLFLCGLVATTLALITVCPQAVKADNIPSSTLATSSLATKNAGKQLNIFANQASDETSDNNIVLINGKSLKKKNNHMLSNQAMTQNNNSKIATKTSESVDDWMPDKNLQHVVAYNLYSNEFATSRINKQDLSKLITLRLTGDYERNNRNYYTTALNIESLEGLQYATNLEVLDLSPDIDSNINFFGNAYWHSHLQDISALKNLNKLTDIYMEMCSIYNISALSNKPKLKNLGISYNGITDFSPLKSDTKLPTYVTAYYQVVVTPQIMVDKDRHYITATYNFKDIDGSNISIRVANDEKKDYYVSNYLSNWKEEPGTVLSDGKTIKWDLSRLPSGYQGYMTVNYEGKFLGQPGFESGGWMIIPFRIY